ncbi:unnamed protein product, partial [Ascophyllum nodosum]
CFLGRCSDDDLDGSSRAVTARYVPALGNSLAAHPSNKDPKKNAQREDGNSRL